MIVGYEASADTRLGTAISHTIKTQSFTSFPRTILPTGRYNFDEQTTLPVGERIQKQEQITSEFTTMDEYFQWWNQELEPWPGARYFWMAEHHPYVGPLVRDISCISRTRMAVYEGLHYSIFSVLVEIPHKDLGRLLIATDAIAQLPVFDRDTPFSRLWNAPME